VADNGKGIAPENIGKIFDPFFTTRMGQGGSGLGLHISHNIVHGPLGGILSVASRRGEGTTFTILIPFKAPV
jgi:signal transduction histidine kinase